ncbi:MAG: hypothetical protein OEW08_00195 [Gammaproteobacteria bacterium]|nr:hypothetical protein [Gammaproteobacteria bacterium]
MSAFHRYLKILLNTLAVFILSYVTLATAAEFMVDQTENIFAVNGKTIAMVDLNKGDVIRLQKQDLVLQDALFPPANSLGDATDRVQDISKVFAFDGQGKLQVECAIRPQLGSGNGATAFN